MHSAFHGLHRFSCIRGSHTCSDGCTELLTLLPSPSPCLPPVCTYILCPFPFYLAPVICQGLTWTLNCNHLPFPETMGCSFTTLYFKFYIKVFFVLLLFFFLHLCVPVLFSPQLPRMTFLALHLFHLSMSGMKDTQEDPGRECGSRLHRPASPSSCSVLI